MRTKSEFHNRKSVAAATKRGQLCPRVFLGLLGLAARTVRDRSHFGLGLLAAMLLLSPINLPAAFVYETATEFLTSGHFNDDTNADVLVLDKATGVGRVGYQDGTGALIWSGPLVTGVENVTGCAVGGFLQSGLDNLAVTSTDYNRVPLIDLSNTNSASTAFVVTPLGIGPHTLAALAQPVVPALTSFDTLLVASAFNRAPSERLELTVFSAGPITSSAGPFNETGLFERGNALQLATNGPTFAAGLVRGDTNDTLHLWQFTNAPSVIASLSNLPPGSDYVFGNFDGQALPYFWFYAPGQSNVISRPLISTNGGFAFGVAVMLNFTQAVQSIYYVAQGSDGTAFLRFGDGIQGARLPGGSPRLAAKYAGGGGAAGNVFTGIAELENGRFALLSAPTGTLSSLHAQVMTFDGTNYTQVSSSDLPAVTSRNTRATVWLFQSEPFTDPAATLISSISVPDWSSGVLGLPASLSVRAENDSGSSSGLGNPATNSLGAPPSGSSYGLPDQYRDDISFFTYAPPRPAEPVIITISPPPGSYGGPIQISFLKQNAGHQVFYRVKAADPWQIYSAPFPLTNDATIQYYGNIPAGTRGRLQFAGYTMGRLDNPAEPPVKLPGSDTNAPPGLNTNILELSGNGTVFYSRHSDSPGFNDSIWAINLDGSGETFITEGARPRVSRDGQWMAFLREGGSVTTQGNLWLKNLSTGAESRFFTNTDSITGFDWNQNTELIFDNNCVLLRQGLNGPATQLPPALTPQCLNGAPVVNPADGRLAFHNLNPNAPGVYVTPPDWSSRTQLTEPTTLRLRWPGWSFDGLRLAMADRTSSAFINTGVNLWTAASDGSNLHQITALTEPAGGFPHGAIWTPDGRALVGAGRIDGTNGLWVITLAADGSACHCPPRLLPTSAGSDIDFAGSILVAPAPQIGVPPGLFIRQEPNAVVVYWSTNFEGYTLESQMNLPAIGAWTPITGPYFLSGGYYEYREPRANLAAGKLFRLRLTGVMILTPPEPELTFRYNPGAVVLNWPLSYAGYTLEVTTNLSSPVIWSPLNATYQVTNGLFEYRRNLPGPPQEFYRLRWP